MNVIVLTDMQGHPTIVNVDRIDRIGYSENPSRTYLLVGGNVIPIHIQEDIGSIAKMLNLESSQIKSLYSYGEESD